MANKRLMLTRIFLVLDLVIGQKVTDVNNLSDTLLQGYNINTRPIINQGETLTVNMTMNFRRIKSFDEVEGKLSTVFGFVLRWKDEIISWNSQEHANISSLIVSETNVWRPDVSILNSFGTIGVLGDVPRGIIKFTSTGDAEWSFVGGINTICPLDTTFYPMDEQSCRIDIGILGYSFGDINLIANLNTERYASHGSWKLVNQNITCSFNTCTFLLTLERLPEFVIINLLIPIITLALLNPLVFLLTVESGERVGFAITTLLALSVFMTILDDYLPRTSKPITRLSYLLLILFGQSALILILTIVSLSLYHSKGSQVPRIFKELLRIPNLFQCKKTTVCCKNKVQAKEDKLKHGNRFREEIMTTKPEVVEKTVFEDVKNKERHISMEYKRASNMFDLICLSGMYISEFLIIVTFIFGFNKSD